jgi:hypothetical protein
VKAHQTSLGWSVKVLSTSHSVTHTPVIAVKVAVLRQQSTLQSVRA